jgi:CheY-like chemotaxis protein
MILEFLFPKRIDIQYDFKGLLECKITNSIPTLIIKNIVGSKKIELIGLDVDELDLNLFLPESLRDFHNKMITDILTKGETSQYWISFMSGKISRSVEIKNPINNKTYSVKLNINYNSEKNNVFLFDLIITDVTEINKIINKTGLLTHDMRAIIKSALGLTKQIEKTVSNTENIIILTELLEEAISMCSATRTAFIPELIKQSKISKNIKLYLMFPIYLKKLKNIFYSIHFTYTINTNLIINEYQENTLWHLILNMVKNSVNAKATDIIFIVDEDYEKSKILIKIIDNGNGMDANTIKNFFTRKLPITSCNLSVDENRGKGFLLSYNQWKLYGGDVIILISEINVGTTFMVSVSSVVSDDYFTLTTKQIKCLGTIKDQTKKIMLVDDVLFNLKLICLKIIRLTDKSYKYDNFPILTNDEWQAHGIIIIETLHCCYVLLANGMYGKEIFTMTNPDVIITDIQMPMLNGIDMIKNILDEGSKSKIIINSAVVEKDDESINELLSNPQITFIEKGDFDWIGDV